MSDFSKTPQDHLLANLQKGYVGIHIQQGVPLLDRDLNLLQDLIAATVRSVVTHYIGNGVATGVEGFAIQALPTAQASQDFRILAGSGGVPGSILVGGVEIIIPANTTYKAQPTAPALTTPAAPQPDPRVDTVYLDVFFIEVDASTDPDLTNSLDLGMATSVRVKPDWVVRVSEGAPIPAAPPGHTFYPLAELRRPRGRDVIEAGMITDMRQQRLNMADMEQRLSLMEKLLVVPSFVPAPLPQFLPRNGVIGQTITLNGRNLNIGAIQVRFNTVPAAIVGQASATEIVVRVPPGLTPGGTPVGVKISVSNEAGQDESEDTFTVQPNPAFAEAGQQFTPTSGTAGTQVTLRGHNFNVGTVQVRFGSTAATLVGTPTPSKIVAQVPAGLVTGGATSANVQITVTTGAGSTTSDDAFRAEATIPAPTFVTPPLPEFTPRNGNGGQTVTLNGLNFNFPPVTVDFEGTPATITGSPSPNQIVVRVPNNMVAAGSSRAVRIRVTTAGGSVTTSQTFNVTGP